ncbi:MAG: hypothetical protein ABL986_03700 [Vicinamibacterales bacterium]
MAVTTTSPPEPELADLDGVIDDLKKSWTSTLTVRRTSTDDVGYREIIVSLDGESLATLRHGDEVTRDVPPGKHQLFVHNTLFKKTIDFSVDVGEHAVFKTVNRAGFLTYSVLAFFLGGGPIYLSVEREGSGAHGR